MKTWKILDAEGREVASGTINDGPIACHIKYRLEWVEWVEVLPAWAFDGEPMPDTLSHDLWGFDPNCKHDVRSQPNGGVKCAKCGGWKCF